MESVYGTRYCALARLAYYDSRKTLVQYSVKNIFIFHIDLLYFAYKVFLFDHHLLSNKGATIVFRAFSKY